MIEQQGISLPTYYERNRKIVNKSLSYSSHRRIIIKKHVKKGKS